MEENLTYGFPVPVAWPLVFQRWAGLQNGLQSLLLVVFVGVLVLKGDKVGAGVLA